MRASAHVVRDGTLEPGDHQVRAFRVHLRSVWRFVFVFVFVSRRGVGPKNKDATRMRRRGGRSAVSGGARRWVCGGARGTAGARGRRSRTSRVARSGGRVRRADAPIVAPNGVGARARIGRRFRDPGKDEASITRREGRDAKRRETARGREHTRAPTHRTPQRALARSASRSVVGRGGRRTLSLTPMTRLYTMALCPPSTLNSELYRPYVAPPPNTTVCTTPAMTPADGSLTFLTFCIAPECRRRSPKRAEQ